ncbi:hypothetical protein [Saccharothrix variisporea]|uniref:Pentapeptide repeat protein n=1 Tax=Saccharothrix variisporea TaxID=543527 RepID=A0A495XMP9_9PSEU|nr:hypothetical protein [Saccharothrix variisporea]RKT74186.1 hypothetical protein DFJ66_7529 [Saccharothrix variisporea]
MTTGEVPAAQLVGEDVEVVGARVTGVLDLTDAPVRTLRFVRCRFDEPPVLREASVRGLEFHGCELPGLDARRLRCRGDVVLAGTVVRGAVELGDAEVGGELSFEDSRVGAVVARRVCVGGDVRLAGAALGELDDVSLDLRGARVGGSVLGENEFRIGVTAQGAVLLGDARLGGALTLRQSRWGALDADRSRVVGDVDLTEAQVRTLSVVGASVGGSLVLGAAQADDVSLDRVRVAGHVHLAFALVRSGVTLVDARIGGDLRASRAELRDLVGTRARVTGDVDLGQLRGEDAVRLPAADVGGSLDLSGADLSGPLDLCAARIGDELKLGDLAVEGTLDLSAATVRCLVDLRGAHLGARLDACGLVTRELRLTVEDPPHGRVDLRDARCATLRDNGSFWCARGGVDLTGLDYRRLEPRLSDRAAVRRRLSQLRAATVRFTPDAYDRLAEVLRSEGQEAGAAAVLVEKQRLQYAERARSAGWAGPAVTAWSSVVRSLTGYGYRMGRGVAALVAVAALVVLLVP